MLLLKNCTFINWKDLTFSSGHLVVKPGFDGTVELINELPNSLSDHNTIDCQGKYVTKSFGNGHNHSYASLCLGRPNSNMEYQNFYEILKHHWWKLDKCLTTDAIKASAYTTAINCAKNGVTFNIDLHSSPLALKGSLNIIAEAFKNVGVNHLLSYEISDRDGVNIAHQGLEETEEYLSNNQGLLGLHASFTLTNSTLKKASQLANKLNAGVHVHVAEDLYDQEHCYDIHNMRVVERFDSYGILAMEKSIFANCLYLTNDERKLINKSKIFVAQNTESNLINHVGQLNSCLLDKQIMLGTDGLHTDMLRASKSTFFSNQPSDNISKEEAYHRFRNIHNYIEHAGFKGDGDNNLVVLDYKPGTLFNSENFIDHFINGWSSSHISHVISNGELIVDNKKLTRINEADVLDFSRTMSKELWKKIK